MARIRTIKPEFPHSESMGKVSRDARLTFIQLWTISDDFGRLRGNSRMLASLLFPYDDDAPALIDGWLVELESQDCITRYEIDNAHYIQIEKWSEHQRVDKPTPSKIIPPSRILANPRESSLSSLGREGKGIGINNTHTASAETSDFQKIYDEGCAVNPELQIKSTAVIHQWIADGVTPEDAVPEIKRMAANARSWTFFTGAVMDAKATRLRPLPQGVPKTTFKSFDQQAKDNTNLAIQEVLRRAQPS